jgi:hypothetical protein
MPFAQLSNEKDPIINFLLKRDKEYLEISNNTVIMRKSGSARQGNSFIFSAFIGPCCSMLCGDIITMKRINE